MRKRLVDAGNAVPGSKRIVLAESLANTMAEAIAAGDLRPGERIIEIPMAQRLGVSRVPLREALKVLHAQGILVGGGHKGYVVAEFGDASLRRISELRWPVEAILLRDALENWRAGLCDPADFEPALERIWAGARQGDRRGTISADIDFHRVIRHASRNEVAGTVWDTLARHLAIIFSLYVDYRQSDLRDIADHHCVFREQIDQWIRQPPGPGQLSDYVIWHMEPAPHRRPGRD